MKTSRNIHVREVYEARNLSKIFHYMRDKSKYGELGSELILFLHQMLLSGIEDAYSIESRISQKQEVRGRKIFSKGAS